MKLIKFSNLLACKILFNEIRFNERSFFCPDYSLNRESTVLLQLLLNIKKMLNLTKAAKGLPVRPGTIRHRVPGTYHPDGTTEIGSDEEELPAPAGLRSHSYENEEEEIKPQAQVMMSWGDLHPELCTTVAKCVEDLPVFKAYKEEKRAEKRKAEETDCRTLKELKRKFFFYFQKFLNSNNYYFIF